jgi:hypothetical protein
MKLIEINRDFGEFGEIKLIYNEENKTFHNFDDLNRIKRLEASNNKLDELMDYKANFLWEHDDGSIEQAGYEFINGKTEEYQKQWWKILIKRIRAPNNKLDELIETYEKEISELEIESDFKYDQTSENYRKYVRGQMKELKRVVKDLKDLRK